jgi:hypothetical protein
MKKRINRKMERKLKLYKRIILILGILLVVDIICATTLSPTLRHFKNKNSYPVSITNFVEAAIRFYEAFIANEKEIGKNLR